MKTRNLTTAIVVLATVFSALGCLAAPEAIEINAQNVAELPGGKEADGIVGDFVLRNDVVTALISQNAPFRKANMGTFWGSGTSGVTPGCLYDLSLRGEDKDQITIFSPLGQRGEVSYVRIAEDCADGEAAIETVVTGTKGNGLARRHRYSIRDGMPGVLITTTLTNETKVAIPFKGKDTWTNFASKGSAGPIVWADAIDPADKVGYAYAPEPEDLNKPKSERTIEPGATFTYSRFLAIGNSPAQAIGNIARRHGQTGRLSGRLTSPGGEPVTTATISLKQGESPATRLYPDADGKFHTHAKPGKYTLRISDTGRETVERLVEVKPDKEWSTEQQLSAASTIQFDIKLYDGSDTPCKVQFVSVDENLSPIDLGPHNRAHGCANQYHSETGQFSVAVPARKYVVIITRGIEFSAFNRTVEVKPGETLKFPATLIRQVRTPGWVSSDFHNHSTPSGDNTCGTDDRLINLAAEHIEFAPTTEHNRLFDWAPHIRRLGLDDEIATVPGLELTGSGAHINAFPFEPDPGKQDGGTPLWSKDPRLTALTLRNHQGSDPDRWLHLNHPDMAENFVDANGDGRVDGGFVNLGQMIDGLETQNGNYQNILHDSPYIISKNIGPKGRVRHAREFVWLQLLNQGHRIWAIAVADAHSVFGNGVGGWRTYVRSSTDDPAKIDWREMSRNAKAGQMILSNGPYLEVIAGRNTVAGGELRSTGDLKLKVKVQCPDWINIDRVQILVNGRQRKDLNFTRESHPEWFGIGTVKFDRVLDVQLSQDSHIIAVAYGHNSDLIIGYGNSPQSAMQPCAYNNPIFVDVDGGGFTPNRDTLGYALPVKGKTVDQIRELLGD